ncbi:hypothetical protein B1992_03745 [Pseudoxanthomonas broegbernensis]|uniref:DUF2939 domain-containing protein n=1 Tax=Pseudoxanthomonas broegbernensis TaxID=83619 RepID=A0A7V8GPP6_9GAMM|nr:DUF2939 domain-containing protein [Pseudoxanthomonas broegbernensis]KAF1687774.1 hypothetical protein B1992_03745 [Pseudoxanthomonas broegbernensis]MBB6064812.1 hypothetical protein [Pseudoxanthomonas broegbernensis]
MHTHPAPAGRLRTLRGVGVVALLLALALAAWIAAGPWLAVRGIERALERRDASALQRHVDFPRLRANLKAQLDDRLVRAAGEDTAASPLGALALVALGGAGGMAVDTLATPAGIAALLQGHAVWQRARGRTVGGDAWAATEPARPLRGAQLRYQSLSRFTATVEHDDGRRTVFVLRRQGLRWRLVDIRLP